MKKPKGTAEQFEALTEEEREALAEPTDTAFYVKREGRDFTSVPLTEQEQSIVATAIGTLRFRMRGCFYNAQRIVLADPTGALTYVEGFRECPGLHAWAALNGKVIDVTVAPADARPNFQTPDEARRYIARTKPQRYLGEFPEGRRYRGVEFRREVFSSPHASKLGASLLDNWSPEGSASGERWPAERGFLDAFRVRAERVGVP